MGKRTIEQIDEEIKRLQKERELAVQQFSYDLGETVIRLMPSIPRGKKASRDYLADVCEIVKRHNEEFAAIRRERTMKNKNTDAEQTGVVSPPDKGDVINGTAANQG